MSNITKIKIDNEREHSYQDFPANREFKKRAEDDNPGGGWPSDLPLPTAGGYGYEEYEEQKTVVTFSGAAGKYGTTIYIDASAYDNPPIDWEVGDILTITINGTSYKVPMRSDPMDQEGDEGMVGWDAGAPRNPDSYWDIDWSDYDFLLHISWYYGKFDGGYVMINDGEGTYDISATVGGDTNVHKIDEKYLPASGGGMMVVNLSRNNDGSYVVDKTFDEIKSAVPNVIMVSDGSGDVYNLSYSLNTIEFVNQMWNIDDENIVSIEVQLIIVNSDNSVERVYGEKVF